MTDTDYKIFKRTHYIGQQENCKLIDLDWVRSYEAEGKKGEQLTQDEINRIIEGFQEVKKAFTKRLNTYLKRYGLTKVHSWTYLSD